MRGGGSRAAVALVGDELVTNGKHHLIDIKGRAAYQAQEASLTAYWFGADAIMRVKALRASLNETEPIFDFNGFSPFAERD